MLIWRCPNRLVTQREIDAIASAVMVERGVLPDPGGWVDQAATFVAAFPLATREIAHWRQVMHETEMRKAQQNRRPQ